MMATVTAQLGISAAFQEPPDDPPAAETDRGKNEKMKSIDRKNLYTMLLNWCPGTFSMPFRDRLPLNISPYEN
jgi:hypothetical protein